MTGKWARHRSSSTEEVRFGGVAAPVVSEVDLLC
jgi:hypothetical protein